MLPCFLEAGAKVIGFLFFPKYLRLFFQFIFFQIKHPKNLLNPISYPPFIHPKIYNGNGLQI